MRFSTQAILLAVLLAFSGCVTSHYKDAKGNDCTRRYFTVFGIPTHSCSEGPATAPATVAVPSATVVPVTPAASAPVKKTVVVAQTPVVPATPASTAVVSAAPASGPVASAANTAPVTAVEDSMDFLSSQTVSEAAKK